jgi:hypothetical protein
MTTYGFILPFPTQNRFSVWFTGGSLEVDGNKNEKWFQIFDKDAAPKRTAFESSKVFAAKLLMGACVNDEMDKDGKLSYTLSRPVASYIDLVYLDNSLQVLRGSSGTVYVHKRLPGGSEAVHQFTYSDELLPSSVDPEDAGNNGYPHASHYNSGHQTSLAAPGIMYETQLDHGMIYASQLDHGIQHGGPGGQGISGMIREGQLDPEQYRDSVAPEKSQCQYQLNAGMQQASSETKVLNNQFEAWSASCLERGDVGNVPEKRSSLKKVSSYGEMEQVGTNIPINHNTTAWRALPKPTQQNAEAPSVADRQMNTHRRVTSDPSKLWSGAVCGEPPPDRTDTESLSTSENEEEAKHESAPTTSQERRLRKSVSFTNLEIRSYDVTVGDNPSCRTGPAVTLDWGYREDESSQVPVMDYERDKYNRGESGMKIRSLSANERMAMLTRAGVGEEEIEAACASAEKIKQQREFTQKYSASRGIIEVEEAIETVQRKAKEFVQMLKPSRSSNSF